MPKLSRRQFQTDKNLSTPPALSVSTRYIRRVKTYVFKNIQYLKMTAAGKKLK